MLLKLFPQAKVHLANSHNKEVMMGLRLVTVDGIGPLVQHSWRIAQQRDLKPGLAHCEHFLEKSCGLYDNGNSLKDAAPENNE